MEAKNLLKRTYGGAVLPDTLHPGHTNIVSIRKDKNIKEKRMIAKKAVELIHDGDMIFLDTSTTNIELAREIIERRLSYSGLHADFLHKECKIYSSWRRI